MLSCTGILGHWNPEHSFNAPDSQNMEMRQMLDIQELPGHSRGEDEPWSVMPYASMLERNEILQRRQEIVASYVITLAKRRTKLVMASSSTTLGALCLDARCLSRRQTGLHCFLTIRRKCRCVRLCAFPNWDHPRSYLTHKAPSITRATALAR
jgi:hypothetical protein